MQLPILAALFQIFFIPFAAMADDLNTAQAFAFRSIEAPPLPLSSFDGKTVLVVNTSSRCGFTRQYGDLQTVWRRYRDRGLVVLGVPSIDFGDQEPGTAAEIKNFCEVNFDVDFPMVDKVQVKGEKAHSFYRWAAKQLGPKAKPRWNFHKYLIAPDGKLVAWFSTATSPTSSKVTRTIEKYFSKAPKG